MKSTFQLNGSVLLLMFVLDKSMFQNAFSPLTIRIIHLGSRFEMSSESDFPVHFLPSAIAAFFSS